MKRQKILINIFSNWAHLVVLMLMAFFVSPIIVHSLGNELYGVWTLIISITGYFTLLNFGVNTAIVRFVSMYTAQKKFEKANEIYNTSYLFFFTVSIIIISISAIFGFFFHNIFEIENITKSYAYRVFFIVGIDIAFAMLFGVLSATLAALQEHLKANMIAIIILLLKNATLVVMLLNGYKILTLAIVQISFNLVRYALQAIILHRLYSFFRIRRTACKRTVLKQIFSYSVYSFIIAIAGRVIFLTDSIVIGSVINVSEVTYYAIPATLIDYLGKIIWSITGALVPVISSHEAVGEQEENRTLYVTVTRYLLAISLPIMFVLFTVGDDFIGIWMGKEYGLRATWVLRILLSGYIFSYAQWIAYSILMGISKHKFLAYIYIFQAVANLGISIIAGKMYGIEGVAFGTMLPLLIANAIIIPIYTCKILELPVLQYYRLSHVKPFIILTLSGIFYLLFPIHVSTYLQLFVYSSITGVLWVIIGVFFVLEEDHRRWGLNTLKKVVSQHR